MTYTPHNHASVQALLEHRTWVRSLARRLVRDENAVDDLEQETWIAAMRKPPQGAPKAWLGAVVRNLASKSRRSSGRREAREQRVARPEQVRSTAEVLAEAEVHEQVVRAVLALPEPFRSTLLLRFFEGLAPREIAVRMGAPVETVRARTRRALERIRKSFDAEHGGRKRWSVMLAPLIRPKTGTTTTASLGLGAILMGIKTKLALAVAAALLLGVIFFANPFADDDPQQDDTRIADRGGLAQQPELSGTPGAVAGADPAPEPVPAADPVMEGARLRVLRGEASVAGASVRLVTKNDDSYEVVTNQRGRVGVPADVSGQVVAFVTTAGGLMQRFGPLDLGKEEAALRLVDGPPIKVRFKDLEGTHLSAAEVNLRFGQSKTPRMVKLVSNALFNGANLFEARLRESASWTVDVTLGADGNDFRPTPRPTEGTWRLLTSRPGSSPFLSEPFSLEGDAEVQVDVYLLPQPKVVHIRAIDDETGQPLLNARAYAVYEYGDDAVFLREDDRAVDAYGQIDLPVTVGIGGPPTWWIATKTHARRVQNHTLAMAGETLVVRCPRRLNVKGTAYLRDGTPAVGRSVMAMLPKHTPMRTTVADDGSFSLVGLPTRHVPGVSEMRTGKIRIVLIEDPNTLEVQMVSAQGLPGETVQVQIGGPGTGEQTASVHGRIAAGGIPLEGVLLMAQSNTGDKRISKTDANGTFRIEGLSPGVLKMAVLCGDLRASDDYLIGSVHEETPIVLRPGQATEINFGLPGGFIEVTIVDGATGKPLAGVAVTGEAMKREFDSERFAGFGYTPGWASLTSDKGIAMLKALPDGAIRIQVHSPNHGKNELTDQTSGTADEPLKVTIRVK